MDELIIYTESKDFSKEHNIKVIGVISGSVTVSLLTSPSGTVIGSLGTITAGQARNLEHGQAAVRITVVGPTQYAIA